MARNNHDVDENSPAAEVHDDSSEDYDNGDIDDNEHKDQTSHEHVHDNIPIGQPVTPATAATAPPTFVWDDIRAVEVTKPYRSPYEALPLPSAAQETTLPGRSPSQSQINPGPEVEADEEIEDEIVAPPAQPRVTRSRTIADSQTLARPSRLPLPRVESAPSPPISSSRVLHDKTASGQVSKPKKKKGKKEKPKRISNFSDPDLDHSQGRYRGQPPPPPGGAAGAVSS